MLFNSNRANFKYKQNKAIVRILLYVGGSPYVSHNIGSALQNSNFVFLIKTLSKAGGSFYL